jgi:hypothetical protein
MKKILIIATMLCSVSAFAQTNQQQGSTNTSSTSSVAAASNQGNAQSITFTAPAVTTQNVNSASTATVTTNGTQTVNQNIAGTTTQNVNSAISGTQTQNVVYSGTQTVKNVPSVSGPNLTSSNDTCMGSASGSANGPGFGISIGKTYTDENCVRLKNSRELWNMGMKAASLALMCKDADNREALELTGFECPQTTKARGGSLALQQNVAQPLQAQYTDPIVRARLGLPPLEMASK